MHPGFTEIEVNQKLFPKKKLFGKRIIELNLYSETVFVELEINLLVW